MYALLMIALSDTNDQYQPLVHSWQLGYILTNRTPCHITGLKARKQGLAYMSLDSHMKKRILPPKGTWKSASQRLKPW